MSESNHSPQHSQLKWRITIGVLIILVIAVVFLSIQNTALQQKLSEKRMQFELISPRVAWLDAEDFLSAQKTYEISYAPLRVPLIAISEEHVDGTYGIYFEDLTSGAWLGIREREKFLPESLLKTPLLVSILKKVQDGYVGLNDTVVLMEEDLDNASGSLADKGAGYRISVRDLLTYLIKESDNTALRVLATRYINETDVEETFSALGLPQPVDGKVTLSPKEYSSMFRSMYVSNYLHRSLSELALSIMLETDFNSQLPAGLPSNVKVAHKVGFDLTTGYFHDCGIIYLPQKPYLLCVMSNNSTQEEADRVISSISRIVYEYRSTKHLPGDI